MSRIPPLPIPDSKPRDNAMDEDEEDDDLSLLLSKSAPKIERHKTVVPIHNDDAEFSDFDRAICIAVDESSNAEKVVNWTVERVLRRRKDLVVLVNVQPESKSWKPQAPGVSISRTFTQSTGRSIIIDAEAKERCRQILAPYAEKLQRDGFVVKGVCLIGNPKEALVASSNIKKPTMLVMGTHGRGSVKRFLMGSVAEYVLHHSDIPVLVVPNGGPSNKNSGSSD